MAGNDGDDILAMLHARDAATARGDARRQEGEGPMDAWNRRTIVLRRGDDGLRIVHEHRSYPMEKDGSGRAATDLKASGE
ncbi:nuclear transport factor 2 family protein [Sphingomonas sanxanigenens]|nr:nuclear transport factor 2 family protein [Sphingomonas sanxanigenens]